VNLNVDIVDKHAMLIVQHVLFGAREREQVEIVYEDEQYARLVDERVRVLLNTFSQVARVVKGRIPLGEQKSSVIIGICWGCHSHKPLIYTEPGHVVCSEACKKKFNERNKHDNE